MSMGGGSSEGANSEINVTPLVDVCLVLLIIFMVMIPQNVPEISVRIPPESKTPHHKKPTQETLVIGLTKDGGITLNRNPLDRTRLSEEIEKQLEVRDRKVVFVDFDDDAKFGEAVEILDLAKQAGAEVLGVMKNKKKKTPDTLKG